MLRLAFVLLAGCGRLGFDEGHAQIVQPDPDAAPDTAPDAAPDAFDDGVAESCAAPTIPSYSLPLDLTIDLCKHTDDLTQSCAGANGADVVFQFTVVTNGATVCVTGAVGTVAGMSTTCGPCSFGQSVVMDGVEACSGFSQLVAGTYFLRLEGAVPCGTARVRVQ